MRWDWYAGRKVVTQTSDKQAFKILGRLLVTALELEIVLYPLMLIANTILNIELQQG